MNVFGAMINLCHRDETHDVTTPRIQLTKTVCSTQPKTNNLFWPDENNIEQCFAANIVQGCQQY